MNGLSVGVVTMVAALCCAVVAGAFLVFSTFVTQALRGLPAADGVAAMRAINVSAIRPAFMITLFGTAAVCVIAVAATWTSPGAGLRLTAAAWYLVGTIAVTIAGNVPLNNRLAAARLDGSEIAALWQHYLTVWTRWNHVRTVAAIVAAVLFVAAALLAE